MHLNAILASVAMGLLFDLSLAISSDGTPSIAAREAGMIQIHHDPAAFNEATDDVKIHRHETVIRVDKVDRSAGLPPPPPPQYRVVAKARSLANANANANPNEISLAAAADNVAERVPTCTRKNGKLHTQRQWTVSYDGDTDLNGMHCGQSVRAELARHFRCKPMTDATCVASGEPGRGGVTLQFHTPRTCSDTAIRDAVAKGTEGRVKVRCQHL
ncbi:hypothetical protein B0T24DRAFT_681610 [Lasiosphaeria ovina]|uniref:Uncharacterized protein n=1 Tax=Lasiosphaeria ovina TaxID=92902 RepID=A0AAE0K4T6_9PEZI|nr:hypothetical protein B0T24DRAFT_681610 [Lasiosphaeria ovina]